MVKKIISNSLLLFVCYCFYSVQAVAAPEEEQGIIDMQAEIVATVGELDFRECMVSAQGRDRKVQCATYSVSEKPGDASSNKIDLFVVRLPGKRRSDKIQDPMLFTAGGPGQSASESYLYVDQQFSDLARFRDFYLIDQRGTGQSNLMSCPNLIEELQFSVNVYDTEELQEAVKKCLEEMPGDVRYYTTDASIDDFEKVRAALGLKTWNVYGVSYGTRVATHYMRKYPESLRTVVLDSPVPPQHILGSEIAWRSQDMLNVLYARCEAEQACADAMPDFRQKVEALFSELADEQKAVRVESFADGSIQDFNFTEDHLALVVRLYLYNPHMTAVLPPMLYEAAAKGNFSPLARAAQNLETFMSKAMAVGLHNSVMCTEEVPFYNLSDADREANETSYMGMNLVQILQDVCSVWPALPAPEDMKAPLESDLPTLLLSGEFDPITPPAYAEQILENLSAAKHLSLQGQGHFVGYIGCTPRLVNRFIEDASVEKIDTACLNRAGSQPLFINFNGPTP